MQALRKYAWDYFSIHAAQRMAAFQFFITLATAMVAGFLLLIRNTGGERWMGILGVLLALFAFVFSKLDKRTRGLIKNGERALKYLDSELGLKWIGEIQHPLALFAADDASMNGKISSIPFVGDFSYSRCFKYVFVGFGLLGLSGAIAALACFPVSNHESAGVSPSINAVFLDESRSSRVKATDCDGGCGHESQ